MMTPQLQFNEFDGQWERLLLGDIFTFKNGVNASKEQYGHGVKFINVLDIINNNFITYENIIGSVNITATELAKNDVEYGDILFQRSSETREEVGQSNVYLGQLPVSFGGFVIRGRGLVKYDALFFHYALKTDSVRDEITQRSGGSTRYNIGQESLSVVPIVIPSLPEQTKIANFLTAVDEKLSQLTHKHDLLTQYKKGVMQQIFSQELRFKDDDGREFAEWEEKTLGDISVKKSSNIAANKTEENEGVYKIYGASGVLKKVDFFTQSLAYISIVKDGAGVGRVFLCEPMTSVLGTMDIIQPIEGVDISFLYAILEQIDFVKYVTGSTIPHIYYKDYSKESVSIPSLKEQTKIANFLTAIDDKITATKTQLEAVKQYKQGLLQQMFV